MDEHAALKQAIIKIYAGYTRQMVQNDEADALRDRYLLRTRVEEERRNQSAYLETGEYTESHVELIRRAELALVEVEALMEVLRGPWPIWTGPGDDPPDEQTWRMRQ